MAYRGAVFGCILLAGPILAQDASQPIVIGEMATIESRALNETRQVYVASPPAYEDSDERYGVLYVLDGDWQFHHAVASAQFLGSFANQMIPPMLVVGIGNTNRMRDMTPPSEAQENPLLAQGGADRFLEFVAEELKPWVDARHRTSGYSVLIGHSLGGLFTAYAIVNRPEAFDGYLMIDPSLNWNGQSLVEQAATFAAREPDLNASVYMAVSSDAGREIDVARRFAGILDASTSTGFRLTFAPLPEESHDSVPLLGTYHGLQWIFSSWDVEEQAKAMFSDAPSEEIFEELDALYRRSGEQYGLARETPYLMFESLLAYLADNDRLDEAAELTLRHSNRYPLHLVPNVIAGIAQLFVDNDDEGAAIAYLSAVLDIYPGNETAREALMELGVDRSTE